MRPVLTAFADSPDRGCGLARDFRVRWTLEELGQASDLRLVSFADLKTPGYRALQPFGQIPAWQEDGLDLFESGAIVLHLAQQHPGLLPDDRAGRARAVAWVFAALDTVEPPIWDWDLARMVERHQPWHAERQPMLKGRIHKRLQDLSEWLGTKDWLEGTFSLGDLIMISVLRRLHGSGLLEEHPALASYVGRGEARPAFRRAFSAQKAVFDATDPKQAAKGPDP
ncbi:glutathione S-transferase family protein [Tabrizicola sp.]|uniref:glutathione S-transferase family protein n=1 Tax=Tabrizicola sp. TaxID=2005166 RepID=UPI003F34B063